MEGAIVKNASAEEAAGRKRIELRATDVEARLKGIDVRFLRLWDLYNGLLTDTQKEITYLYFACDLSLGEIAEQKGISRQGVSECLQKCKVKLEAAEEKIHFAAALDEVCRDYSLYRTRVDRWTEAQRKTHPEWGSELDELSALTGGEELVEIR